MSDIDTNSAIVELTQLTQPVLLPSVFCLEKVNIRFGMRIPAESRILNPQELTKKTDVPSHLPICDLLSITY